MIGVTAVTVTWRVRFPIWPCLVCDAVQLIQFIIETITANPQVLSVEHLSLYLWLVDEEAEHVLDAVGVCLICEHEFVLPLRQPHDQGPPAAACCARLIRSRC
jgi:hypothetical protein